jgi:hypothetical protein
MRRRGEGPVGSTENARPLGVPIESYVRAQTIEFSDVRAPDAQTTTKSPSLSIATLGKGWVSRSALLTVITPLRGAPSLPNILARTNVGVPSVSRQIHVTTNAPSGRIATDGASG